MKQDRPTNPFVPSIDGLTPGEWTYTISGAFSYCSKNAPSRKGCKPNFLGRSFGYFALEPNGNTLILYGNVDKLFGATAHVQNGKERRFPE